MLHKAVVNVTIRYIEQTLLKDNSLKNNYINEVNNHVRKPLTKEELKGLFSKTTRKEITNTTFNQTISEDFGKQIPNATVIFNEHKLQFEQSYFDLSENTMVHVFKVPHIEEIETNNAKFEKEFNKYYEKELKKYSYEEKKEEFRRKEIHLTDKCSFQKELRIENMPYKLKISYMEEISSLLGRKHIYTIKLFEKTKLLGIPFYKKINSVNKEANSKDKNFFQDVTPEMLIKELRE